ncbi:EI24 domain-containing protein [Uliginosibacterium flavum]|uniref:EI24 domain-containing protein n=1 Tax=Uliginosibacterium flavum TaxID=1396831 RepID=A0ABV2TQE2_9RHOO
MSALLQAAVRALRSLAEPGVLWHLLWPALLSAVVWIVLGALFIGDLAAAGEILLPGLPWLGKWFVAGGAWAHLAVSGLLQILLWCLLLPLIFVSALLLVATVALPLMLERVAALDYVDLQRCAGGSQWGSLRTSLRALASFLALLLLSLPLWLIPGAGLVISVLLSARLNRTCFSYDALMNHADTDELARLPQIYKGDLTLLGAISGVLAFVPILNFVVPAWSGLAFVHYLLEALRRERARPLKDIPQE